MWISRRRLSTTCALGFCLVVTLAAMRPAKAGPQKTPNKKTAEKTTFLVARPEMKDPLFKESVILMLPSSLVEGGGLVVGVIVNRPAKIPLSSIFPSDPTLKDKSITAYFGGPVEPHTPGIIFRSKTVEKDALLLFGDVYVTFDSDAIEAMLKKQGKAEDLRLFLGRSQWAPEQLQDEMLRGAWYKVDAETDLLFSGNPQYLWRTLANRADPASIAMAARPRIVDAALRGTEARQGQ